MTHLVQISNGVSRHVALVEESNLRCLSEVTSVYELALLCLKGGRGLNEEVRALTQDEVLDYDAIYNGRSEWRLLAPIDVPGAPSHMLVAGTGLTHYGSAKDRQAMHASGADKKQAAEAMTDSMRMFQWGRGGGRPKEGEIGIVPEWFYKGNGSILRGPFEPLTVPAFGEDGGEEAEIVGIYIVGEDSTPRRIGMTVGNEFSRSEEPRLNSSHESVSRMPSSA